jgi:DNA repair photolyase
MAFTVLHSEAKGILSQTCGFIAEAGFTHSLTPARNCGFACTYCYVPTMRVYGGLKPEDWRHWGQFTTFKDNAPELLARSLGADQVIYCSPLVDPYQPAEASERMMPRLLDAFLDQPPRTLAIQTRGPLILRDLKKLATLATLDQRLRTIRQLSAAGIRTYATLAPLLPCNPEALVDMAVEATTGDIIGDPFHVRQVKTSGATTREPALLISERYGYSEWHDPEFQADVVARLRTRASAAGRNLQTGIAGFHLLV